MSRLCITTLLLTFPLRSLSFDAAVVLGPDGTGGDSQKRMMRHHVDKGHAERSAGYIGPAGELLQRHGHAQKTQPRNERKSRESDFCDDAYVLGTADTNDCTDASKQTTITRESLCRDAATAAGAAAGQYDAKFEVDYDNEDLCPWGCFRSKTNTSVFFFNPNGNVSINPGHHGGTPVCRRKRYMQGTIASGCPTGYEMIDGAPGSDLDRDACWGAGDCGGYQMQSEYFDVGILDPTPNGDKVDSIRPPWAQVYNNMPKGCFIRSEVISNKTVLSVYFNVPQTAAPTSPTAEGGVPICRIISKYATS